MPKPSSVAGDLAVLRGGNAPPKPGGASRVRQAAAVLHGHEPPATRRKQARVRGEMNALFEDDAMATDRSNPSDQGDDANLRAALAAVVASIASGNLSGEKAVDAILGAFDEADDDQGDGYEPDRPAEEEASAKNVSESRRDELLELHREGAAASLLESLGSPGTYTEIRRVARVPQKRERHKLARAIVDAKQG